MNRTLFISTLLAVAVLMMSVGVGAAAVVTVDDSGGEMYMSIYAAIDAASPGVWLLDNDDLGLCFRILKMKVR